MVQMQKLREEVVVIGSLHFAHYGCCSKLFLSIFDLFIREIESLLQRATSKESKKREQCLVELGDDAKVRRVNYAST